MNIKPQDFWKLYTITRWRLQTFIKKKFAEVDWRMFPREYTTGKFDEIYSNLISKWKEIKEEISANDTWTNGKSDFSSNRAVIRLKGAFYEALFYLAWLKMSVLYKGGEIANFISPMESYEPKRVEIVPLFQPFPLMFYHRGRRVAPQIDADFLLLYISREKKKIQFYRPTFIDVKSSEQKTSDRLRWQAVACAYMGSLMQVVWPLKKPPKEIEDWEVRNVCYNCGNLSKPNKCDKCGTELSWVIFFMERESKKE